MFEAVQDLEINNNNVVSKKLQFVKLLVMAIILGFTLTVTVLVSEDQSVLSKLACTYKPDFPITSESRLCENDVRFNLSSGLYVTPCMVNSVSYLILQQIENGGKTTSEVSLNSEQWNLLKLEVSQWEKSF